MLRLIISHIISPVPLRYDDTGSQFHVDDLNFESYLSDRLQGYMDSQPPETCSILLNSIPHPDVFVGSLTSCSFPRFFEKQLSAILSPFRMPEKTVTPLDTKSISSVVLVSPLIFIVFITLQFRLYPSSCLNYSI